MTVNGASDSDSGPISLDKVKEHLKRTRYSPGGVNYAKHLEEEEEEEEEIGTKSVMLDGAEINLEDSNEVTPDRVKAILAQSRKSAAAQSEVARRAEERARRGTLRTPKRPLKRPSAKVQRPSA